MAASSAITNRSIDCNRRPGYGGYSVHMILKMLLSPVVWVFMMSSLAHSISSARDKAVEIFYMAAEIEPGGEGW